MQYIWEKAIFFNIYGNTQLICTLKHSQEIYTWLIEVEAYCCCMVLSMRKLQIQIFSSLTELDSCHTRHKMENSYAVFYLAFCLLETQHENKHDTRILVINLLLTSRLLLFLQHVYVFSSQDYAMWSVWIDTLCTIPFFCKISLNCLLVNSPPPSDCKLFVFISNYTNMN